MDFNFLQKYTMHEALTFYHEVLKDIRGTEEELPLIAELGRQDRFFLLTHVLNRADAVHSWLYDRCREVEADPDSHLDLWSRFHYKSTFITFAGIIQEILVNPEITICILSYNNATATAFLSQIKRELEQNELLKDLYPDVLYKDPGNKTMGSSSWSLDKGLLVKRKTNPKEFTLEAYGLVDNQPTGRHYMLRVYDDVVTDKSVTTADMIQKTTEGWELSLNLGANEQGNRQQYVGTRYNANDTYHTILERKYVEPRIYPATHDGTPDGDPVYMTEFAWEDLKKGSSDYMIACQQLLNPLAGSQQELNLDWVRRWDIRPKILNLYILCDPAGGKKDVNCNTAMTVIGVDAHYNKYLLDGACHKMNLEERYKMLSGLYWKWKSQPGIQSITVGYEKYSMQSDIEHFQFRMKIEDKYFPIDEVGGSVNKDMRIRRVIPDHKNWSFFYPETSKVTKKMEDAVNTGETWRIAKPIRRINSDGKIYELVEWFLRNEYVFFPHSTVKDMLDCIARLYDFDISAPLMLREEELASSGMYDNFGGPSWYKGQCMEPDIEHSH